MNKNNEKSDYESRLAMAAATGMLVIIWGVAIGISILANYIWPNAFTIFLFGAVTILGVPILVLFLVFAYRLYKAKKELEGNNE